MTSWMRDVRQAVRALRGSPGFTLSAVATLVHRYAGMSLIVNASQRPALTVVISVMWGQRA